MKLRPAHTTDGPLLLAWRNDPAARLMSLDQRDISRKEHEAWLAAKLQSEDSEIWIGVADGRPVGQVRFDLLEDGVAVVSIAVAHAARGRGHGRRLLLAGIERQRLSLRTLRAQVRPENEASLKLFQGCGFCETSRSDASVTLERRATRPTGR